MTASQGAWKAVKLVLGVFSPIGTLIAIHSGIVQVESLKESVPQSEVFLCTMMWSLGVGFYGALAGAILGWMVLGIFVAAVLLPSVVVWILLGQPGSPHSDPNSHSLRGKAWHLICKWWIALVKLFVPPENNARWALPPLMRYGWAVAAVGGLIGGFVASYGTPPTKFDPNDLVFYIPGAVLLGFVVYLWPAAKAMLSSMREYDGNSFDLLSSFRTKKALGNPAKRTAIAKTTYRSALSGNADATRPLIVRCSRSAPSLPGKRDQ